MSSWFVLSPMICVVLPEERALKITNMMIRAGERLMFRSDGKWFTELPQYPERFGRKYFMVTVQIMDDIDAIKRRYSSKGTSNYTLSVPFRLIDGMSDLAMATFFEEQFIGCCEDAAKRWGVTIHWRVDPTLRSPA